jgi:hypothetical protein
MHLIRKDARQYRLRRWASQVGFHGLYIHPWHDQLTDSCALACRESLPFAAARLYAAKETRLTDFHSVV